MSTENRNILVTASLKVQWVRIAETRQIARGPKCDASKSLSECRDLYWKKHPHWYRRVGKMIAQAQMGRRQAKQFDYDGFAGYLDGLSEGNLVYAFNKIKASLPKVLPAVVTPAPVAATTTVEDRTLHGTSTFAMTVGTGVTGTGPNEAPGTSIVDPTPQGFTEIPTGWQTNEVHVVDLDNQHQLQGRLRQALMSVAQCRVTRDVEDGDLDMDRLTDIGSGTNLTGLFQRFTPGKQLSVAVQIFADVSGSMHDHDDSDGRRQLKLCMSLGSVLERMKVPFQVIAYDESCYLVKGWTTKLRNSMVNKMPLAMGGTRLASALATGFPELVIRREARKLAVIISDGDIGTENGSAIINMHDSESGQTWNGHLPATHKVREKYPEVETCFFGIGSMKIPDMAFDYKVTGLSNNLVEEVSQKVVKVIVG